MNPLLEERLLVNRRVFFGRASTGIGTAALATLLNEANANTPDDGRIVPQESHFAPRVKRVIYLFQSGGPSQLDLYDPKPGLLKRYNEAVPTSVYPEERKTTMTSGQASFPVAPSRMHFRPCGQSGMKLSHVLPHISGLADDMCLIRSMHTDAINHDPAITFFQTGATQPGRPSIGAWMSYGLGTENSNLPAFVAMSSRGRGGGGQPLYDRLWGAGFLPGRFQGVKFRNTGEPILDIGNPSGVDRDMRRRMLDATSRLNALKSEEIGDPEINTRIAQYELAYRMQASVPDLVDTSSEPKHILDSYGPDVKKQGTYAYNCLLARRLAERGVRFIQLFHQGWDMHGNLPDRLRKQTRDTDQPSAALVRDLEQRGMLDDTLIIWGGEFGRTVYCQGKLSPTSYGRDHHPSCFSVWLAGGGIKGGVTHGRTDDYSVNVVENGVEVHDLHATILHQLGLDHEKLTYKFQGRRYRLTDVRGRVLHELLT